LTQNPAGLPPRVGSTPTSGTNFVESDTLRVRNPPSYYSNQTDFQDSNPFSVQSLFEEIDINEKLFYFRLE
jgi:hypothetical protein